MLPAAGQHDDGENREGRQSVSRPTRACDRDDCVLERCLHVHECGVRVRGSWRGPVTGIAEAGECLWSWNTGAAVRLHRSGLGQDSASCQSLATSCIKSGSIATTVTVRSSGPPSPDSHRGAGGDHAPGFACRRRAPQADEGRPYGGLAVTGTHTGEFVDPAAPERSSHFLRQQPECTFGHE